MASIHFYLRPSKKDLAPLTMRLDNASKQYTTITKILVDNDFKKIYKKNVRSPELRNKQNQLDKKIKPLEKYVLDAFYDLDNKEDIPNTWLKEVYKKYLNPNILEGEKLNITYWFDHKIKHHKKIKNAKGGFGLSPNTLKGYRNIKEVVLNYEDEIIKRKLKLSDMTQVGFEGIKDFLFESEGYKSTSSSKALSVIKTIGKYARKNQMQLPYDFESVEIERAKTHVGDEDVIYLTDDELKRIISLELKQNYLINARKWLLLGCYTGQRIGDQLTKFTKENIFGSGDKLEIRLTQGKTGAKVTIPVHSNIRNILKPENMPHAITPQKLNDYMKKVCELAEINEPIDDQRLEFVKEVKRRGKDVKKYRKVKKVRPKYEYFSSHTGRRTFCMMFFDLGMPIQHIRAVSGHTTEKSFLTYINKKNDTHMKAFRDVFDELDNKK